MSEWVRSWKCSLEGPRHPCGAWASSWIFSGSQTYNVPARRCAHLGLEVLMDGEGGRSALPVMRHTYPAGAIQTALPQEGAHD